MSESRQDETGEEPISLVGYDERWPAAFAEERDLLARTIAPWVHGTIEHVGSTAVAGLIAKPVIDIMVGVRDLPSSLPAREVLAAIDYLYYPYRPEEMHWFCKPSPARRTHHLHLVPFGSRLWTERLAFRDYLRRMPEAAREYAALKATLAERYRFDREAYTNAKGPFIMRITNLALAKH